MGELEGRTALITGASSGLGADFARGLAARGCQLVLVARREARLKELAQEIAARYGVAVQSIPLDLMLEESPEELYDQLRQAGTRVDVLVNNAGFGVFGEFVDIPWQQDRNQLALDVRALVHLTKLFLADMLERDFGYVLQVASIGGYQPSPSYAIYAAAKAFVLNFGEALHYELRKRGVGVTVVSPGVTATEFLEVAGHRPSFYQRLMMMKSRDVAEIGIRAMLKGRPSVVAGWRNALVVWMLRFTPRRLMAATANAAMRIGS